MKFSAAQNRAGFTLIELVISGGLMSVILVSAYLCLSAGTDSQRMVEARSDSAQSARVALAMIAAELRSAVPLSKEMEFIGMRRTVDEVDSDNLDFATRNYVPKTLGEADWCEVSYFVQKDQKTSEYVLYRRRDPTPDPEPLAGGAQEEIVRGVRGFRLEYYDGWDWYDEWGDPLGKQKFATFPDPNVSGLPEAVKITLTLDNEERVAEGETKSTVVLQTTARINMALFFYRATGGGTSSTNANSSSSAAPAPAGAQPGPGGPQ
jgi:type II secretion system protein J